MVLKRQPVCNFLGSIKNIHCYSLPLCILNRTILYKLFEGFTGIVTICRNINCEFRYICIHQVIDHAAKSLVGGRGFFKTDFIFSVE